MSKRKEEGIATIKEMKLEMEVATLVNYMYQGKPKINHPDNKKEGVKPNVPLTVEQSCREYGIHINTFYNHLKRYPDLREKYEELKQAKREAIKDVAEHNISKILRTGDLTDKEKFDASFKVAQATIKEYNPKTEIETKSIGINLSKTSDDLISDLKELLGQ